MRYVRTMPEATVVGPVVERDVQRRNEGGGQDCDARQPRQSVLPAIGKDPRTGKQVIFNSVIAAFTGRNDARNRGDEALVFDTPSVMDFMAPPYPFWLASSPWVTAVGAIRLVDQQPGRGGEVPRHRDGAAVEQRRMWLLWVKSTRWFTTARCTPLGLRVGLCARVRRHGLALERGLHRCDFWVPTPSRELANP